MSFVDHLVKEIRDNISFLTSKLADTKIYVDIGGGLPGSTPSLPLDKILNSKLSIIFEPRDDLYPFNYNTYNNLENIIFRKDYVLPDHIEKKIIKPLESYVDEVFILDIDIDGYDYFLAENILKTGIKPVFLFLEINENFPPPVKFQVNYDSSYTGPDGHFYGMSLSQANELTEYGYDLVQQFFNSIVFIRKDKNPYYQDKTSFKFFKPRTPEQLYQKQYLNLNLHKKVEYNQDVLYWHDLSGQSLLNAIHEYFKDKQGKYKLSI